MIEHDTVRSCLTSVEHEFCFFFTVYYSLCHIFTNYFEFTGVLLHWLLKCLLPTNLNIISFT